jgi:hypothetical protein
MIDNAGTLALMSNEDLRTMENVRHPVNGVEDIPPEKRALFELINKAGNRRMRKREAKRMEVNWHEYQIYVSILKSQEVVG